VAGEFRIFYALSSQGLAANESKTVEILRVIIKGTETTARTLGGKP